MESLRLDKTPKIIQSNSLFILTMPTNPHPHAEHLQGR